tara:strand:+ start:214 stop:1596 length:1383 start_codon:yes stop_codon:yes gene_type:complete
MATVFDEFAQSFGLAPGQTNYDNVKEEGKIRNYQNEQYNFNETIRKRDSDYLHDKYQADVRNQEKNLRFQEDSMVQNYLANQEMRDFEYDTSKRAYDLSVSRAAGQKSFNRMASEAAIVEQDQKHTEDMLSIMFDEGETLLNYKARTTGLKITKDNALIDADFQAASNKNKYTGQLGALQIERNKARSESQINTQNAILEGMKAAGAIRARGSGGRSAAKAALGVLAESGARQAAIANGLMYAEQGVDLGIAQLKDMLILDQTMVLAAKDRANNEFAFKDADLQATNQMDLQKIKATKFSTKARDTIVRRQIANARLQADMQAENSILLEPDRLPDLVDPRVQFAEYDNKDTEYIEMLLRPEMTPPPEFVEGVRLPDPKGSLGRQNFVSSGGLSTTLTLAAGIAGAIPALGVNGMGLNALGNAANTNTFLGMGAQGWADIGKTLGTLGTGLSPKQQRTRY